MVAQGSFSQSLNMRSSAIVVFIMDQLFDVGFVGHVGVSDPLRVGVAF